VRQRDNPRQPFEKEYSSRLSDYKRFQRYYFIGNSWCLAGRPLQLFLLPSSLLAMTATIPKRSRGNPRNSFKGWVTSVTPAQELLYSMRISS
jgi:hypothetical protein